MNELINMIKYRLWITAPTESSPRIERVIIAKFLKLLRGKPVEVPYGGQIDACTNTVKDSDGTNCLSNGIIQDQSYTHETSFPVFSNAPKVCFSIFRMFFIYLLFHCRSSYWFDILLELNLLKNLKDVKTGENILVLVLFVLRFQFNLYKIILLIFITS